MSRSTASVTEEPLFVFNPSLTTKNIDLHQDGGKNTFGSYLYLKKKIGELGLENLFLFDDHKKELKYFGPWQYIRFNFGLLISFGECFGAFSFRNITRHDFMSYVLGRHYTEAKYKQEASSLESLKKKSSDFFKSAADVRTPETLSKGSLLSKNLCIGESHSQSCSRRFLIENMETFAKNGYKTLFLEHLFYDSAMQRDLDLYFRSTTDTMPKSLENYLNNLGKIYCTVFDKYDEDYNFVTLVMAAKKYGLRIVGIDTVESYKMGDSQFGSQGEERMKGMNYEAKRIIEEEGRGRKWLALMGNAHISQCYGVLGVSQITDNAVAVDIYLDECSKTTFKAVNQARKIGGESITSDFSISYKRDSSLKLESLAVESSAEGTGTNTDEIDGVLRNMMNVKDILLLHRLFRINSEFRKTAEENDFDEWYEKNKISTTGFSLSLSITSQSSEFFNILNASSNTDPSLRNLLPAISSFLRQGDDYLLRKILAKNSQLVTAFNFLREIVSVNSKWQEHKKEKISIATEIYNNLSQGLSYEGYESLKIDDNSFLLHKQGTEDSESMIFTSDFEDTAKNITFKSLEQIKGAVRMAGAAIAASRTSAAAASTIDFGKSCRFDKFGITDSPDFTSRDFDDELASLRLDMSLNQVLARKFYEGSKISKFAKYISDFDTNDGIRIKQPLSAERIRYNSCFNRKTIVPVTIDEENFYWPANFVNFDDSLPGRSNSHLIAGEPAYTYGYEFWLMTLQNNVSSIVSVVSASDRRGYEVEEGKERIFEKNGSQIKVKCELLKVGEGDLGGVQLSDYWKDDFRVRKYTITHPDGTVKTTYHFLALGSKGGDPVTVIEQLPDQNKADGRKEVDADRLTRYSSDATFPDKLKTAQAGIFNFIRQVQDCQIALGVYGKTDTKTYAHCTQGPDRTGTFCVLYHIFSQARKLGDSVSPELIKSSLNIANLARRYEASTASGGAVAYIQRKLTTVSGEDMLLLQQERFLSIFSKALHSVVTLDKAALRDDMATAGRYISNTIKLRHGDRIISIDGDGIDDFSKLRTKLIGLGLITDSQDFSISIGGTIQTDITRFNEQTPGNLTIRPRSSLLSGGAIGGTTVAASTPVMYTAQSLYEVAQGVGLEKGPAYKDREFMPLKITIDGHDYYIYKQAANSTDYYDVRDIEGGNYSKDSKATPDLSRKIWDRLIEIFDEKSRPSGGGSGGYVEPTAAPSSSVFDFEYRKVFRTSTIKPQKGIFAILLEKQKGSGDLRKAQVAMGFEEKELKELEKETEDGPGGKVKFILEQEQRKITQKAGEKLIKYLKDLSDKKITGSDIYKLTPTFLETLKSNLTHQAFYSDVIEKAIAVAHEVAVENDGLTRDGKIDAARTKIMEKAGDSIKLGHLAIDKEDVASLGLLTSRFFYNAASELKRYSGRMENARQDKLTAFSFKRSNINVVAGVMGEVFQNEYTTKGRAR